MFEKAIQQIAERTAVTTHTPTPISTRITTIATGLGWTDDSHCGDTDYGMYQRFLSDRYVLFVGYAPDGRQGVGDVIQHVVVKDHTNEEDEDLFKITNTDLTDLTGSQEINSQPAMRAALVNALVEYGPS